MLWAMYISAQLAMDFISGTQKKIYSGITINGMLIKLPTQKVTMFFTLAWLTVKTISGSLQIQRYINMYWRRINFITMPIPKMKAFRC